ncbi:glycosyltransferase family 4 protein [Patescibacteria group bacterium]|nr:glycosyltransferase family 4 protein [Patescibacteria group bacterium]
MHIIIDATTTQDQLSYAGIGQYTKSIILALVKQYPDTQYSLMLFDNKVSTIEPEIYKYKNVKIERIGKYRLNDYKNDLYYYTQILPAINRIKQKDSIYYCPYFWRNYPAYTIPTVLFVHDMNLPMFNMYSQQSKLHNLFRKIQYWFTLNKSMKCKHIITNSQTSLNDYLKYYPNYPKTNTSVSYLGADMEEKEANISEVLPKDYKERKYVIYLGGALNWTKNTKGVIKGYAEFLKHLDPKQKQPYLVISGKVFKDENKKEVKEFHKLISKLKIKDNVIFTGFYKDEEKYSLLKNSFAFMHLALYEGFGISPLEAIRAKTPTIIHESNVYKEVFKDLAIFVNGKDEKEVGKTLYDIYMNPDRYKEKVEKAYILSQKYSWEETAKKTHEVFEKVKKNY